MEAEPTPGGWSRVGCLLRAGSCFNKASLQNTQIQKSFILKEMKQNSTETNGNSTKPGSSKARDLTYKRAIIPDCPTSSPHTQKFTNLRPHSSPCRVYSRNAFQNVFRPSSSTTALANPILSFFDVKRILFQRMTDKGDELKKAFELLDANHSLTVSKSELKRVISTFLLPLTREQFRDVLAQIPLTSSGAVPYLEFLSRFGGIDLNINVIKRGSGDKRNCCRTLEELEIQVGKKEGKVDVKGEADKGRKSHLATCGGADAVQGLPRSSKLF